MLVLVINPVAGAEFMTLLIVFFLVLPLANGLWDWLSWWATRCLGAHLHGALTAGGKVRWLAVLGHGAADLANALALLGSMAFTIALGFELFNQVILARTGQPAFELRPFLEASAAAPFGVGFWLSVMLLSTLLPTLLHILLLCISPFAIRALPSSDRLALAEELRAYGTPSEDKLASIRRRAAKHFARERHLRFVPATSLTALLVVAMILLVNFAIVETSNGHSNLAGWVLTCANAGLWLAEQISGMMRWAAAALGIG